jgi:predicted RNA-binding protein with PIN domain
MQVMRYLIDTYNLLHAAIALAGPLRNMTVRKLCRYLSAAPASLKATLVLDGRPKPDEPSPNEFPDLTLLYSGTGVTADAVIAQTIERSTTRKKLTVVTNDRAVALHARSHYAHAISCEQFLRQLTEYAPAPQDDPTHKSTGTPTAGETDHWMKEFGLDTDPNPNPLQPRPTEDPLANLNIEDLLGPRGSQTP